MKIYRKKGLSCITIIYNHMKITLTILTPLNDNNRKDFLDLHHLLVDLGLDLEALALALVLVVDQAPLLWLGRRPLLHLFLLGNTDLVA